MRTEEIDLGGNNFDFSIAVYNSKPDPCEGQLSEVDAFLYGLPGGFTLAGLLLLCFITFGRAITARRIRNQNPSASSNTRTTRDGLGKKKKRGPPPSSDLRPVDVISLAMQDTAPEDIKEAIVQTGKFIGSKTSKQLELSPRDSRMKSTLNSSVAVGIRNTLPNNNTNTGRNSLSTIF